MGIPLPSENQHWPAFFYPPDADEANWAEKGRIFQQAEDVPEGWAHHWSMHGKNLNREPPPAPVSDEEPNARRKRLREELTKRDIVWHVTMSVAKLQEMLDEALAEEAADAAV
jgi:hypothetical protein